MGFENDVGRIKKPRRSRRRRFGGEPHWEPMGVEERFKSLGELIGGKPINIPHVSAYFCRVLDHKCRSSLENPSLVDAFVVALHPPFAYNQEQVKNALELFEAFKGMLTKEFEALNAGEGKLRKPLLRAKIKVFTAHIHSSRNPRRAWRESEVLTYRAP